MMKRRTWLQSVVGALVIAPLARIRAFAQGPAALTLTQVATLSAVADVVLPAAIGESGRAAAVDRFVRWVRGYREGADRGHGYGASTLSQPTGPSPAGRYPPQFAALDEAARTRGGAAFADLSIDQRRAIIEEALTRPQLVANLPTRPNGTNLIADFMGYYFTSPAAYDLAYNAAIGRDTCRTLDGSDRAPAPLTSVGRG